MENSIIKLSWHDIRCVTYNLVLVYISPKAQVYVTLITLSEITYLFKNFNTVLTKKHNDNLLVVLWHLLEFSI